MKSTLPLLLVALCMAMSFSAEAAKKSKKVYYVVAGSYSSFEEAKKTAENISEVMFYSVYKVNVKGKVAYRLCCECFYTREKAQEFINEYGPSFCDKMWIWESNGLGNCVYRPLSPADGETRIPLLKPHW